MFRRLFRKDFDGPLTAEMVSKLIRAYGKILEQRDFIVYDVSRLPANKDRIVAALKAAWLSTKSETTRSMIEVAWFSLATFQQGVGDARIRPPSSPPGIPSQADLVVMQTVLKWLALVNAEGAQRRAEIEAFKAESAS